MFTSGTEQRVYCLTWPDLALARVTLAYCTHAEIRIQLVFVFVKRHPGAC